MRIYHLVTECVLYYQITHTTMRIYPHQSVYVCYTLISPHFSAKLCVLTPHELCVHIPHLPPCLCVCVCQIRPPMTYTC